MEVRGYWLTLVLQARALEPQKIHCNRINMVVSFPRTFTHMYLCSYHKRRCVHLDSAVSLMLQSQKCPLDRLIHGYEHPQSGFNNLLVTCWEVCLRAHVHASENAHTMMNPMRPVSVFFSKSSGAVSTVSGSALLDDPGTPRVLNATNAVFASCLMMYSHHLRGRRLEK